MPRTDTLAFSGSLANGVVTGTLTYTVSFFDQVAGNATGTFPITAR